MSIESRSKQYGAIFGDWHIGKKLGSGSNGQSAVFELYRNHDGWQERSALKVISLIEERGNRETMPLHQRNEYSTESQSRRSKAEDEVRLMDQVRGKTNIVDYLDHKFFEWTDEDGFGADLLIRMELLTDLRSLIKKGKQFTQQEIIRLGRDICQALVICHEKNILHRDIKPENIFVSADGDYKLGDFGVSRMMKNASSVLASTNIGTPAYAAPEQVHGQYDNRVDIYSLGLVLYELSNGNRLPFAKTSYLTEVDIQQRLAGTPLPVPGAYGSENLNKTMALIPKNQLSQIILKACAYKPENRYQTARELLTDLCSLEGNKLSDTAVLQASVRKDEPKTYDIYATAKAEVLEETVPERKMPDVKPKVETADDGHGSSFGAKIIVIAAAVLCLFGLVMWMFGGLSGSDEKKTNSNSSERKPSSHSTQPPQPTQPSHTHDWAAPTSRAPKTCKTCGATQGRSLGTPLTQCALLGDTNQDGSNADVRIGNWEDCFNVTHYGSIRFWVVKQSGWSNTESAVFALNKQYQVMDVCVQLEKYSQSGATAQVKVYLDGDIVKISSVVDKNSAEVRFTLDVGEVSQIRIECVTDTAKNAYCIVDATLYVT